MFEALTHAIRTDLDELHNGGMRGAIALREQTDQWFNHNDYPMYFVGKLDAPLVLVHLNPKQADLKQGQQPSTNSPKFPFDNFMDFHQRFGERLYGKKSPRKHKSQFDLKQIRFLRPFNVLPFVEERTPADTFTNLERVIDEKLQLELIPYGSDNFSLKGFTPVVLAPHKQRLLDVISACEREYVIFCGQIFAHIFHDRITATHSFKLPKKDGSSTKSNVRFSNLVLEHNGKTIRAGIAHSFALMGIPMAAYGERCHALYGGSRSL